MGRADFIGDRGEVIAHKQLAMCCRIDSDRPYFVPHHLGEKSRTFDYLVELVDADEIPLYFFVQVKTTRKAMTKAHTPPRLRVEVGGEEVRRMVACPMPTDLVGVQEVEERAFIVAVHGEMSGAISSMTTAHELTPESLRRLWEEVRDFWLGHDLAQPTSSFSNRGDL